MVIWTKVKKIEQCRRTTMIDRVVVEVFRKWRDINTGDVSGLSFTIVKIVISSRMRFINELHHWRLDIWH